MASVAVPAGQVWKLYYYAGSQRVAMRTDNGATSTVNWIVGDHLGSTSKVADLDGDLVSTTLYKPWGEMRYSSGNLPTNYTYTGQYSHTDDFGLMFYNARWYDSALGRFAQADTIVPSPYKPSAFDRYSYAYNNPVRFIDPSGHCGTSYDEYTEAELEECYGINIEGGPTGSDLAALAEALWKFAKWVGGITTFREKIAVQDGLHDIWFVDPLSDVELPLDIVAPRDAAGEYFDRTGRIHLYMENIRKQGYDLVQIIIHELAHVLHDVVPDLPSDFVNEVGTVRPKNSPGEDYWYRYGFNPQMYTYVGDPNNLLPYPGPGRPNSNEQIAQAVALSITDPKNSQAVQWGQIIWDAVHNYWEDWR